MSEVCAPPVGSGINALQRKRLCQLRTAFFCAFAGVAAMVSAQFIGVEVGETQAPQESKDVVTELPEISKSGVLESTTTTAPELVELNGYNNNSEILTDLVFCETRGNYQANTGNGYFGGLQFDPDTWNALDTGYARPDYAPPAVQDAAALEAARIGGGFHVQFPGCAAELGLPDFPFSE